MTWAFGVDASFSRITEAAFRELAQGPLGARLFVQDLWTGGYQNNDTLRAVAAANLRDAQAAGYVIAGYTNASPYWPVDVCLRETIANAGEMWPRLVGVVVDVEIDGTPEDAIRGLCEALERKGKRVAIYSARWFWVGHLGNPQWPWLTRYKIANAFYDSNEDIDFARNPWGPWSADDAVVWEQYQGTTALTAAGVSFQVDLGVCDADFFAPAPEEDSMPLDPNTDYDAFKGMFIRMMEQDYKVPVGLGYNTVPFWLPYLWQAITEKEGAMLVILTAGGSKYVVIDGVWKKPWTNVQDAVQLRGDVPRIEIPVSAAELANFPDFPEGSGALTETQIAAIARTVEQAVANLPPTSGASKADLQAAVLALTQAVKDAIKSVKLSVS